MSGTAPVPIKHRPGRFCSGRRGADHRHLPAAGGAPARPDVLIAHVDRQNASFAKLHMLGDLGMTEAACGLGASLFFTGCFLFEVPWIKDRTGNTLAPMLSLVGCLAFAGLMIFVVQGLLGRTSRAAVPAE